MIKNQTQNNFLICLVVLVGLLFEWLNKSWLFEHTNYAEFYTISSGVRAVLLIFAARVAYFINGSTLLWLLMFFNLCAIFLNIVYLSSAESYYILRDYRREYFAPAYRALEVLILLWTGRDAGIHLHHIVDVIRHRLSFVATRRRVYAKAKKL